VEEKGLKVEAKENLEVHLKARRLLMAKDHQMARKLPMAKNLQVVIVPSPI